MSPPLINPLSSSSLSTYQLGEKEEAPRNGNHDRAYLPADAQRFMKPAKKAKDCGVYMRTWVVVVALKGEYGLHQCHSHMAVFTYQGLYLSAANTPKPAKHPAPTPARTPAM